MRHPAIPKKAPAGWVWLFELARELGITNTALAAKARKADDIERYERYGEGPTAPWIVSAAEADRLRAAYHVGRDGNE